MHWYDLPGMRPAGPPAPDPTVPAIPVQIVVELEQVNPTWTPAHDAKAAVQR